MLKTDIRALIKQRKQCFSAELLCQWSENAIDKLFHEPHIEQATTIVAYHSLPDEVATHKLLEALLITGKTIYLPSVEDNRHLKLHRYLGEEYLKTGAYNIKEAQGEALNNYDSVEVALIPGVAFDRENHRLGRGGGYYDRLLPLLKNAFKIGLCFDFQYLDTLPTEKHDVTMDKIYCVKTFMNT